jgi:AraC-like DNA-binding protein
MLYLEQKPSRPLSGLIRSLWYAHAPELPSERQRVLPNGSTQFIITLAADHLTDCIADTLTPIPPAILAGPRLQFEIVHTRDMAELVGIIFRPGGLGPFLRHPVDAFFEQSVPLDAVWNQSALRERLHACSSPSAMLSALDSLLLQALNGQSLNRKPTIEAALHSLCRNSVRETAATIGVSERRLHQLFREDVGLSPKAWSRVHRFQRALKALYKGTDLPWDQLALDCGYYDQAHFANDFHAFSGVNPSTYIARRGQWTNHIAF